MKLYSWRCKYCGHEGEDADWLTTHLQAMWHQLTRHWLKDGAT